MWFAIATGAKMTCFWCWPQFVTPDACQFDVFGNNDTGEPNVLGGTARVDDRTVGMRSRSSHTKCPSQKSQTNAMS
jgi:hypothetical protein